jgi:RNA polymerase sigma-70 factor, ECF subfamily
MKITSIDPDAALMQRAAGGDLTAFEELVRKYQKSVINTAYRFTGNPSVAEELAQEVFIRIYKAGRSYKPTARFSTWLFTIVRNICSNYRQREGKFDRFTTSDIDLTTRLQEKNNPEADLIRKQMHQEIQKAIQELPESLRLPLILNQYQRMQYGEIAQVMNLTLVAVKVRIHRARQSLMEKLLPLVDRFDGKSARVKADDSGHEPVTGPGYRGLK